MILFFRRFNSFLLLLGSFEEPAWNFPVDQVAGMIALCQYLHQAVFPVFFIEPECKPYQHGGGDDSEADADPLVCTRHIHDDKNNEYGQQPGGKDEQVLRLQA